MVRVPHVLTAPQPIRRLVVALSLLLPLAAVALVWRPLLGGWFQADDFNHLYDLVTMDRVAFLTQVFAGHLLTMFNAATLGLVTAFGPEPAPAFRVVFGTHLLSAGLVYVAARRLGVGALGAGWSTFAWGTCPTLAGTLETTRIGTMNVKKLPSGSPQGPAKISLG